MTFNRFALLTLFLALTACKAATTDPTKPTEDAPAERLSKSAPITETATPNKPATTGAATAEGEDLNALRAELEALNGDLDRLKTDLSTSEPQRQATQNVVPDTQISTPRALATDGILDIPDSKADLAAKYMGMVEGVRIGAHEDKTRLVIEISGSGSSKPLATLSGKTLLIQLYNTEWPGAEQQLSSLNDQLGVSKVSKEKDDTIVTIALNTDATLKAQMLLPPASAGGARRFVVDLGPVN